MENYRSGCGGNKYGHWSGRDYGERDGRERTKVRK